MKMRRILTAVILLSMLLSVSFFTNASAAPSAKTVLHGSTPAWANSHNYAGPANASTLIGFRVYLGWKNASAVEALAKAVSDPRSVSYGHYLTAAQFRQQFAPSQADVLSVQNWLKSQGFSVTYTPLNNHYVAAEGSVAQAQAAFGVTFGMYNVNGLTVRSPSADVSIPSALAGLVTGVAGLDDSAQFVHTNHVTSDATPPPAFVSSEPCSLYWPRNWPPASPTLTAPGRCPTLPAVIPPRRSRALTASRAMMAPGRPWRSSTRMPHLPSSRM